MKGEVFRFVLLVDSLAVLGTLANKVEIEGEPGDQDDPGSVIYQLSGDYRQELEVLERLGVIKLIRDEGELVEIQSIGDIQRFTKRVQILRGGSIRLRVYIANSEFEFDERELLGPTALRLRLLRLKQVVSIKSAEWNELLKFWLDHAEAVDEIEEKVEVKEAVLQFLHSCTVYRDIEKAIGNKSLFFTPSDPDVVLCLIKHIKRVVKEFGEFETRRIAFLLNDFIRGRSMQRRVAGARPRFWAFKITDCDIDLNKQMHKKEDAEGNEENEMHDSILSLIKKSQEEDHVLNGAMINVLKKKVEQFNRWSPKEIEEGIQQLIESEQLVEFKDKDDVGYVKINEG